MVNHILGEGTSGETLCGDWTGCAAEAVSTPPEDASCTVCLVRWAARMPEAAADNINSPSHYTWLNGIEVIDITENLSFTLGNVVKYVLRADHKGKPIEDLKKAAWYLDREIQRREAKS